MRKSDPTPTRSRGGGAQRRLDLPPPRGSDDADDFIIGASNMDAVRLLRGAPSWPDGRAVLIGPGGSGKTHLLRALLDTATHLDAPSIADASQATAGLLARNRPEPGSVLVFEDADRALGDAAFARHAALAAGAPVETLLTAGGNPHRATPLEFALFHLCNMVDRAGASLLLTGRSAADRWPIRLPDLKTRLRGALSARIGSPEPELAAAIFEKRCRDRGFKLSDAAIDRIADALPADFAAIGYAVDALDRASAGRRRVPSAAVDAVAREVQDRSAARLARLARGEPLEDRDATRKGPQLRLRL